MSFMSGLPRLHHFPKPSPPNAITLGVRVSKCEFWGLQTFSLEYRLSLLLCFSDSYSTIRAHCLEAFFDHLSPLQPFLPLTG